MSTSGTYLFTQPKSVELITDAYERIGELPSPLVENQIISAQRSLNFILSSWINRGLNLWTVKQGMLALNTNQYAYSLPLGVVDWLEATLRQSQRNLGGISFSSAGGNAASAFDQNPATACTQTSPDGYISYNWGMVQFAIGLVGIQSNVTIDYTLVFEYSNDNITWMQVGAPPSQTYEQGVISWFVILVPTLGRYFRVRETGGATLDVQELYFNTTIQDTIISRQSRAEYVAQPNKAQTGQPTTFYIDRQISPTAYIWPTPYGNFNNIYYTYINQIEDIGSMINSAEIPTRFLEPLCATLAFQLAQKKNGLDLNKLNFLKSYADEQYALAATEDRERVPLRIYGDYMQGWTQV